MYPRARRKILLLYLTSLILCVNQANAAPRTIINATAIENKEDTFENNIIDSDSEYEIQFDSKYGINPAWHIGDGLNKNTHKYTMIDEELDETDPLMDKNTTGQTTIDKSKIPDENMINSKVNQTVTNSKNKTADEYIIKVNISENNAKRKSHTDILVDKDKVLNTSLEAIEDIKIITKEDNVSVVPLLKIQNDSFNIQTENPFLDAKNETLIKHHASTEFPEITTTEIIEITDAPSTETTLDSLDVSLETSSKLFNLSERDVEVIKINDQNTTRKNENETESEDTSIPIYTELDYESDIDVPEDYYDAKDLVPTKQSNKDAFSMLYSIAGTVAETVAERVLPKGIFDLFKRMQKQSEAIEAERLRSREENGGLGQFGRGILKSISSGISRPFNQLMAGVRDIGSLDTDRSFVTGLASGVVGVADGVANVANSVSDAFKDRVQAIFPGTLWCGDGHSAAARSHELGLFFLTDTCCRQHDACKQFIRAGETKHGLTNTGLFTRSHCSCDTNFRNCLRKTSSLVSSQIGITYFNVLGPQCFRKAHPIVRCVKRTRITGQKCEEYELDYSKVKMWQWFDSETF